MNKLLTANLRRLKKEKIFWIGFIFMLLCGAYLSLSNYIEQTKTGFIITLDGIFFVYIIIAGFFTAIFGSIFIGTEYSDGVIRNKLIAGHKRISIYFANLITVFIAELAVSLAFMAGSGILGGILLDGFEMPAQAVLLYVFASILTELALAALFTLIAMLCSNRALTVVLSFVLMLSLFGIAVMIDARLSAPEYLDGYVFADNLGGLTQDTTPNPKFLSEQERPAYQFMLDLLPTGQVMQISTCNAANILKLPIFAFLWTAVTTFAGIFVFRKKDIK